MRLLSATLLLLALGCPLTKAFDLATQQLLHSQLMKDYNKHVVPMSVDGPVMVEIGASILHFEMDEQDHSMSLDIWLKLSWNDPRLKWDETEHDGLHKLSIDADRIWLPDITLYTTTDWGNSNLLHTKTRTVVMNTGEVIYVPPTNVRVPCVVDVTLWPYDSHKCRVKFGSWVYDGYTLDIKLAEPSLELEMEFVDEKNHTRGEWSLSEASLVRSAKYYACCPEPYVDISFYISSYRRASGYCWTVMMPIVVLSFLTLASFLLPPASGEKILVASLSLLANILFLDYTSRMISHSPTHTPILVKLLCLQLLLLVLGVLLSALVLSITRGPHNLALPSSLKLPLLRLSGVLGLSSYAHRVSRNNGADLEKTDRLELGEENQLCSGEPRRACNCDSQASLWDWLLLGAVVDRLCLVIYLVIFILCICAFGINVWLIKTYKNQAN